MSMHAFSRFDLGLRLIPLFVQGAIPGTKLTLGVSGSGQLCVFKTFEPSAKRTLDQELAVLCALETSPFIVRLRAKAPIRMDDVRLMFACSLVVAHAFFSSLSDTRALF